METEGTPGDSKPQLRLAALPGLWATALFATAFSGCAGSRLVPEGKTGSPGGRPFISASESDGFAVGRTTDPGTRFLPVGEPVGSVPVETPPFGRR